MLPGADCDGKGALGEASGKLRSGESGSGSSLKITGGGKGKQREGRSVLPDLSHISLVETATHNSNLPAKQNWSL